MAKGATGVPGTRPSASSVSVIARRLSPDPEWNARPADGLAAGRWHAPGRWGWHPSPADSAVHPPLGRAGVLAGIHGPIEVVAPICGVAGVVPDVPVHVPVAVGLVAAAVAGVHRDVAVGANGVRAEREDVPGRVAQRPVRKGDLRTGRVVQPDPFGIQAGIRAGVTTRRVVIDRVYLNAMPGGQGRGGRKDGQRGGGGGGEDRGGGFHMVSQGILLRFTGSSRWRTVATRPAELGHFRLFRSM